MRQLFRGKGFRSEPERLCKGGFYPQSFICQFVVDYLCVGPAFLQGHREFYQAIGGWHWGECPSGKLDYTTILAGCCDRA